MSTPPAEDIAAALVAARSEGRSLTRFPGVVPTSMAEAHALTFLFHCEHVGCPHDAPCCFGLSHAVTVGRAPATAL